MRGVDWLVGDANSPTSLFYKMSKVFSTLSDDRRLYDMASSQNNNGVEYYKHAPLDITKQQIRLLKIQPYYPWQKRITCEIKILELSQAPAYQAVSYEWGPEYPNHCIVINGRLLSVRSNLWDFLDILRRRGGTKKQYFWADQICIDQTNNRERSHQVQLMGSIYSNATIVIAWLGLQPKPLHGVSICVDATINCRWRGVSIGRKYETHHCVDCTFKEGYTARQTRTEQLAKFEAFISNPYWFRPWIIQEISLAKRVVVCVGQERIAKQDIVTFLHSLWRPFQANFKEVWRLTYVKALLAGIESHERSLWSLIDKLYSHDKRVHCSDPRDLIYGLLGMVAGTWIQVDYNIAPEELFGRLLEEWTRNAQQTSLSPNRGQHFYFRLTALSNLGAILGVPVRWRTLLALNDAGGSELEDTGLLHYPPRDIRLFNSLIAFACCIADLMSIAMGKTRLESYKPSPGIAEAMLSAWQPEWSLECIWSAMSNPALRERLIERVRLERQAD